MDEINSYYDYATKTIYPRSTSTWSGLSGTTWADYKHWDYSVADQLIWFVDPIDFGLNPSTVNINITCVSTGRVSYKLYTSDTGVFGGEETVYDVPNGSQNIPSIKARFLLVYVYSDRIAEPLNIQEITIEAKTPRANELYFNDVDSSLLSGSNTERIIPVPDNIGTIMDIKITPHEVTAYNLDVYVANTATSTYVVPKIISKSVAAPSFALVGLDNHPRDAVVDIVVKTLNKCRMSGNNIVSD